MQVTETTLPGVLLVEPVVPGDTRGWFKETWSAERYAQAGIGPSFVQDNTSRSTRGALRGLHFQEPYGQGKLVWASVGAVFDVAVDVRRGSPDFAKWVGFELSSDNHRQLWIPAGFAHGFCVLSDVAEFTYKCTEFYRPDSDRAVRWDDPAIGVDWPVAEPILSERDRDAPLLADAEVLPVHPG